MELTEFGMAVRVLRLRNSTLMKDLAEALKSSPSHVSSVEFGRKQVPKDWPEKISNFYNLPDKERQNLEFCAFKSNSSIDIDFDVVGITTSHKELAGIFQRKLPQLTEEDVAAMKQYLIEARYEQNWKTGLSAIDDAARN